VQEAGAWQQVADAAHTSPTPQTAVVRHETLGSLADLKAACERIQSSLDIVQGPVWRVGHFETPDETRVLIAIHHLSVDGVSWRV
ncbi:condensation domain-containing protein, partial [Paraburkholderia phenoliruptrix]